jgi:hypothetical protein
MWWSVRFVRDGNLVTAAGVMSGIEMSLWLVERLYGLISWRRRGRTLPMTIRRGVGSRRYSLEWRSRLSAFSAERHRRAGAEWLTGVPSVGFAPLGALDNRQQRTAFEFPQRPLQPWRRTGAHAPKSRPS